MSCWESYFKQGHYLLTSMRKRREIQRFDVGPSIFSLYFSGSLGTVKQVSDCNKWMEHKRTWTVSTWTRKKKSWLHANIAKKQTTWTPSRGPLAERQRDRERWLLARYWQWKALRYLNLSSTLKKVFTSTSLSVPLFPCKKRGGNPG